jgi:hypothetical protein
VVIVAVVVAVIVVVEIDGVVEVPVVELAETKSTTTHMIC